MAKRQSREQSSSIKKFIDENPFSILLAVIISTATVTGGVSAYLAKTSLDSADERHKNEIVEIGIKDKSTLMDAVEPLRKTIADLSFRVSSIERRIPGAGPSYIDISTIMIGPEAVKALGQQYIPYFGGELLIAPPMFGDWRFEESNEYKFNMHYLGFGEDSGEDEKFSTFRTKILVWRGKSEIDFRKQNSQSDQIIHLFPAITVEKIDAQMFQDRGVSLFSLLDEDDSAKKTKITAKILDDLNNAKKSINNKEAKTAQVQNNESKEIVRKSVDNARIDRDTIDFLGKIGSSDFASLVTTDIFSQATLQIGAGIQHKFYSAQKKRNVLYIQEQLVFTDAILPNDEKKSDAPQKASVDLETLFFCNGNHGFLIKMYLPQVPNRSDAFTWIRSWLAGLQIPLE